MCTNNHVHEVRNVQERQTQMFAGYLVATGTLNTPRRVSKAPKTEC
jgi:hypothetical protein